MEPIAKFAKVFKLANSLARQPGGRMWHLVCSYPCEVERGWFLMQKRRKVLQFPFLQTF